MVCVHDTKVDILENWNVEGATGEKKKTIVCATVTMHVEINPILAASTP